MYGSKTKRFLFSIAGFVLVSFFLHTIEFRHAHPHHSASHHDEGGGSGVEELSVYLHSGERKTLGIVSQAQPLVLSFFDTPAHIANARVVQLPKHYSTSVHGDHLRESLRIGLLNPKLYEMKVS